MAAKAWDALELAELKNLAFKHLKANGKSIDWNAVASEMSTERGSLACATKYNRIMNGNYGTSIRGGQSKVTESKKRSASRFGTDFETDVDELENDNGRDSDDSDDVQIVEGTPDAELKKGLRPAALRNKRVKAVDPKSTTLQDLDEAFQSLENGSQNGEEDLNDVEISESSYAQAHAEEEVFAAQSQTPTQAEIAVASSSNMTFTQQVAREKGIEMQLRENFILAPAGSAEKAIAKRALDSHLSKYLELLRKVSCDE